MSQQPSYDELRRALRKSAVVIQEQERTLAHYREPIAVIGMGCRFPGDVTSPDEFWELLRTGRDVVSPRSVIQDYPGYYLGEPGWFDAAFFGISPREAQDMDPQQQVLLEVCVEAFEDANLALNDMLGSRIGVYIGVMNQDYAQRHSQHDHHTAYTGTGSEVSFLAGRLSYSFGFQGLSMAVGTACSSSLVSTHVACQALRHHECDLAVTGGVSLIVTPNMSSTLSEMHATSPDGRCKTFDARADGCGRRGVTPDILIGHSVGELVAACLAGVFSLEDELKLVAARGRLMGELPPDGEMVAIAADEARVRDAIAPYTEDVSIAAVNGPTSVVISGRTAAVRAIAVQCEAKGLRTHSLTVSHAFHSPLMEPMLDAFRTVADGIIYHAPIRRLVSNLTGELAGDDVATANYWVRHVREAVRFADGVTTLHAQGVDIFLEIGPKPVLLGMIGEPPTPASSLILHPSSLLPSLRACQGAWQTLLTSLGALYVRGATVNWAGLHRDVIRHKIALPTYPFQRQRYWVDALPPQRADALRPLVDRMVRVARRQETIFEKTVSTATLPFLADHQIYGTVVIPGAFHLAMALSGAGLLFDDAACVVEDVIFLHALALAPDEARMVQMTVTAGRDGHPATFEVISQDEAAPDAAEVVHATGRVGRVAGTVPMMDIAAMRARCPHALAPDDLYTRIAATQVDLGPHFQWFAGSWTNGAGEALAQMRRPAALPEVRGYPLFPSLLDACFQLVAAATGADSAEAVPVTRVPFALERLTWYQPGTDAEVWCSVVRASEPAGAPDARWDLTLGTAAGDVVATIQGFQMRAIPASAISGTRLRTDWLTTLVWQSQPIPTTQAASPACWLLVGATDALAAELADHAPVTHLAATADAATLRQQVDALAGQYPSLGVVFWGDVGCRSIIPNDGHSERSEESRSGPSLRSA